MVNRWRVWSDKSQQRTRQKHAEFIKREAGNRLVITFTNDIFLK